jgi:hypothetical protein
MSAEAYIQVPPDSTGKRVRSIEKTVGTNIVQEEVFVVGSPRRLVGVYQYSSPVVSGSTTAGHVYHSIFNPSTSTNLMAVRRIVINWVTIAAALFIEGALYRITSAVGGTGSVPATSVGKKDTSYPTPTVEIRHSGVTVTLENRIFNFITPGAAGQTTGIFDLFFDRDDGRSDIILRPGQGLALRQEAAGDADFRVSIMVEWEEFQGVTVTT